MIDASNLCIQLIIQILAAIPGSPLMFVFGVFIVTASVGIIKQIISFKS